MAKGRMINQKITKDKRVHNLSDDTSRLAFTWLISFADVEGRTYGDPAIVKSMLFPRRDDVTIDQMGLYIQEWHQAGLIILYEAEDDLWIEFPKFSDNQVGLRKDREAKSNIPAYQVRSKSGASPEQVPVKRKEKKRKEEQPPATYWTAPRVREFVEVVSGVFIDLGVTREGNLKKALIEHGEEKSKKGFRRALGGWKKQKRKDNGQNYSVYNAAWVDWGIEYLNDGIERWKNGSSAEVTQSENGTYL